MYAAESEEPTQLVSGISADGALGEQTTFSIAERADLVLSKQGRAVEG